MTRPQRWKPLRLAAVTLVTGALALAGCSQPTSQPSSPAASGGGDGKDYSNTLLTLPREDMGTFTRNFNPFSPNAAPMTQQAIYEPLLIFSATSGQTTPWLATEWKVGGDGKSVEFTIRPGVKWSDGEPLTADDVVYTFELQKKLLGGYEYVDKVSASGDKVTFAFNKAYSPALFEIGQHIIIPKHIWSTIKDPAKATNEKPVGSGPYTEITRFAAQAFELGKNPNYWQPDKQKIAGIKMLAFSGNDGANLAAVNGDVDWTDQFMPNIEKTFVAKDPAHRHYWFPPTGSMINWQLNTTKAPFNDPVVRKALSMAVDRDQVTKIGMNGYTVPADCTGLSGSYEKWKDTALRDKCEWTKLNVEKANQMLDEAGYAKNADGKRTLKDGKPFEFKFSVGATSSDWLSVANVIAQNMDAIGVTVKVDSPDWAQVVAGYEQGDFDSGIVWSPNDPAPYKYFAGMMSTRTVKPVGKKATDNHHRFGDPRADALLDKFSGTSDEATQKDAVNQLQQLFNENAPVIPLFPGPEWGAFNDLRFTGWPTEQNPYASLSARSVQTVLILTSLEPRKG